MAACPTLKINSPPPPGSSAVPDLDRMALVLARPSLVYYGDDTSLVNSGGSVTNWPSLGGLATTYAQGTASRQPVYGAANAPVTGGHYADFTATGDDNADRLLWTGSIPAVTAPQTVIDVLWLDSTTRCFLDGGGGSPDALYCDFFQGQVRQAYGSAIVALPFSTGVWGIVTRSWDGAGHVEIHVDGARVAATAAEMPTTPRILHMGNGSADTNTNSFDGRVAARLRFSEYIGADRAFFSSIAGKLLQQRYARSANPIAAV